MKKRFAIILAAGKGTRMKSKKAKVLHPILGRPMVEYIIKGLQDNHIDIKVSVVGHGKDQVMNAIGKQTEFVTQNEQLGTAHAVIQAKEILKDKEGTTIIVCGDTPLIKPETIESLFQYHESSLSEGTILTANMSNPFGYGRVVRDNNGEVERIVEEKDANENEKLINEVNTGTYCFDNEALFNALERVNNENAQGEYYLTDIIEILREQSRKISAFVCEDTNETMGINDRVALANAEKEMKRRINENHLINGVSILAPDNTYIGPDVTIEQDVTILPGTMINGLTHIKTGSIIGPNSEIVNCTIGQHSVIRQSVVKDSKIGNEVNVGPFAHIRPDTTIGNEVRIGNFVEVKKSDIGNESKVSHLSYIGDAELGKDVNVGCGTITVNYDGVNKHKTVIENHSFIGCNTNLLAPVTIGKNSFVAAGSTINRDVPQDALAIGRAKQVNKEDYATRIKNKSKK